jgi:hypothetical protein
VVVSTTAVTVLRLVGVRVGVVVASTWPPSLSFAVIRMLSSLLWCNTALFLPQDRLALLTLRNLRFSAVGAVSSLARQRAIMLWLDMAIAKWTTVGSIVVLLR